MLEARDLPNDIEVLKRLILDQRAQLTDREHEIERLKLLIARLKRLQFGRSSEKLDGQIGQLELVLEDLETNRAGGAARKEPAETSSIPKERPVRRPLPAHLPRERVVHEPACTCSDVNGNRNLIHRGVGSEFQI